jgi:hypothetical protein
MIREIALFASGFVCGVGVLLIAGIVAGSWAAHKADREWQ